MFIHKGYLLTRQQLLKFLKDSFIFEFQERSGKNSKTFRSKPTNWGDAAVYFQTFGNKLRLYIKREFDLLAIGTYISFILGVTTQYAKCAVELPKTMLMH